MSNKISVSDDIIYFIYFSSLPEKPFPFVIEVKRVALIITHTVVEQFFSRFCWSIDHPEGRSGSYERGKNRGASWEIPNLIHFNNYCWKGEPFIFDLFVKIYSGSLYLKEKQMNNNNDYLSRQEKSWMKNLEQWLNKKRPR